MTTAEWVNLLTPVVGPLLTAGAKKVIPAIPPKLIPVLAVVLGALANLIGAKTIAAAPEPNYLTAVLLGLAGIGVYEATKPLTKGAKAVVPLILAFLCFGLPASAADAPKAVEPTPPPETVSYYKANEFSIDLFGGLRTDDFDNERSHAGVGATYFLTQNWGLGASTSWEDMNGQFLDNFAARGIYRIPINRSAIYGYLGGQFLLDNDDWAALFGVGVEHRWKPWLGTFVEIGMHKEVTGNERDASATAKVGVRIPF